MQTFYTKTDQAKSNCLEYIKGLSGAHRIRIDKPKRSIPQNSYWHSLIDLIAAEVGYDPDEFKELLKCRFLGTRFVKFQGEGVNIPIPSSSLDTKQYAELIDKTILLAHELGIKIPPKPYYGVE